MNSRQVQDSRLQDQTTQPIDLFFIEQVPGKSGSTLALDAIYDSNTLVLADATDFDIGKYVLVISALGRVYQGEIIGKSVNTLTVDSPLDFAFSAGDEIFPISPELAVDGSTTKRTFRIRGPIGSVDLPFQIDITRIILEMVTTGAAEFNDFGDITNGLTKGIVFRRNNGITNNVFNAKTNGELANLMYDLQPFDPANPSGVNGLAGRLTFGGQDKHGVVFRLAPDESLDLIVQDNLSSLLKFRIMAQGHLVE